MTGEPRYTAAEIRTAFWMWDYGPDEECMTTANDLIGSLAELRARADARTPPPVP
jgi:hypothetical protein